MADEPQWLDPVEMRIWRAFIEVSSRVTRGLDTALKVRSDLTLDDYEVLVHLSEAPEHRLRMTELSDRLISSKSRLSQRVDRLERRGLVERVKCPTDRRGTFAVVTAAGMRTIAAAAAGHVADVREWLIDHVDDADREHLARVLETIAERVRDPTGG